MTHPTKQQCCYCGVGPQADNLRPYGPGGAWVCFDCAMSTTERKQETERNFVSQLEASGPVAVICEETGPRPLERSDG